MSSKRGKLFIGTSGWTYEDWYRRFYPEDIPRRDWLSWYAQEFATTEINGSFYRTPSCEAVQQWRGRTPANFRFAWKASKFITHWKRLTARSVNSIELMVSRLQILGRKCGPVLFQLPPRFHADRERLASFIDLLPVAYRYAFEFRDMSWYEEPILELLHDHNISLCLSDHHDAPSPWIVTARHVYVRGHGPGGRYRGNYPEPTLRAWAEHIQSWRGANKTVYVYFDNDQKSAAPKDAKRLTKLTKAICSN
jgi:uncharacterized protein YecE (DUF72 family)